MKTFAFLFYASGWWDWDHQMATCEPQTFCCCCAFDGMLLDNDMPDNMRGLLEPNSAPHADDDIREFINPLIS